MSDLTLELMTKLITLFENDATLGPILTGGVHDIPPEDTDFPYITISDITGTPFDTKDEGGFILTVNINIWDQGKGTIRAKQIQGLVYDLLHNKRITLAGGTTPDALLQITFVQIQDDNKTVLVINRYTFTYTV